MKNKTKKVVSLVLTLAICTFCVPTLGQQSDAVQTKSQLQSQIEDINAKQAELDAKMKQLENDASQQEEYQKQLSEQMDLSQQKIDTLQSKIDIINSQIIESEIKISEKEQQIAENTELFKKRLRAMYVSGNDSTISIILGSTDFYEMVTAIDMVKRVTQYDKTLVNNMIEQVQTLEAEKQAFTDSMAELSASRDEISAEVATLSANYEKSAAALNDIQNQQTMSEEEYQQLTADKLAFQNEIDQIVAAERAAAEKAAREAAERAAAQAAAQQQGSGYVANPDLDDPNVTDPSLHKYSNYLSGGYNMYNATTNGTGLLDGYVGGYFIWPVQSVKTYISSYFTTRYDFMSGGEQHPAIDIAGGGIYGAPILASNSGYVKRAQWSSGYGYNVFIDHGGGYFTLYGHCSALACSAGQWVEKGQVIAYVGATGNATGPHVHFEVWENYQRANPLNFVNVP